MQEKVRNEISLAGLKQDTENLLGNLNLQK